MAKTSKRKPNVIAALANNGDIMTLAVLLAAVDNYTRPLSTMSVKEVEKGLGGASAFFSPAGWLKACQEIQGALAAYDKR